jgi:hypothetical protein
MSVQLRKENGFLEGQKDLFDGDTEPTCDPCWGRKPQFGKPSITHCKRAQFGKILTWLSNETRNHRQRLREEERRIVKSMHSVGKTSPKSSLGMSLLTFLTTSPSQDRLIPLIP